MHKQLVAYVQPLQRLANRPLQAITACRRAKGVVSDLVARRGRELHHPGGVEYGNPASADALIHDAAIITSTSRIDQEVALGEVRAAGAECCLQFAAAAKDTVSALFETFAGAIIRGTLLLKGTAANNERMPSCFALVFVGCNES